MTIIKILQLSNTFCVFQFPINSSSLQCLFTHAFLIRIGDHFCLIVDGLMAKNYCKKDDDE